MKPADGMRSFPPEFHGPRCLALTLDLAAWFAVLAAVRALAQLLSMPG